MLEAVRRAIAPLGLPARELQLERRSWRVVGQLADHMIFACDSDAAWTRLTRESRVLSEAERAGLPMPHVVLHCGPERVHVRTRVRGISGIPIENLIFGSEHPLPSELRYRSDCPLTERGHRLARDLGSAIAHLHTELDAAAAQRLGFSDILYPDFDGIERVASATAPALVPAVQQLRAWYASITPEPVLAHRDIHMHNIAVDPETGALCGIFDLDEAGMADRYEDLKYLHSNGAQFASIALAAYLDAGGAPLELERVRRYHVLAAFKHFTYVPPEAPRFPKIVAWADSALAAFAPDWR